MMLTFGNTPVPFTVMWTAEAHCYVGRCPIARRPALCNAIAPGRGQPRFGTPHSQRQRAAIANSLCDLCGKPLKNRTKVSLSHAHTRLNGAEGPAVLQVEPLLHRECAATSMEFCPSLRRDIRAGTLAIRQVTRFRTQFAVMSPVYVATYAPDYVAKPTDRIVGHAKVELLGWADRDEAWLKSGAA